jgi:hypothetical protein
MPPKRALASEDSKMEVDDGNEQVILHRLKNALADSPKKELPTKKPKTPAVEAPKKNVELKVSIPSFSPLPLITPKGQKQLSQPLP